MNLPTSTHALHFHQWWTYFGNFDSNKRKLIDCAYEYYLEYPMKAELKIVCSGYLIPKEDAWENSQNVLVSLRFSYHHFNRRRKQEDNSSYILGLELWIWFICCVNEWHWCVCTTSAILCNILKNEIEKSLHKAWDRGKHTVPSCPWTCKRPWRETMPKPIEGSHSHWVRLTK